jgi:hypothetical protein
MWDALWSEDVEALVKRIPYPEWIARPRRIRAEEAGSTCERCQGQLAGYAWQTPTWDPDGPELLLWCKRCLQGVLLNLEIFMAIEGESDE